MGVTECYCDYERPEFYERTTRTARKAHKCYECDRLIARGERYEYVAAKNDGQLWTAKTCSRCLDLRDYVLAHVPCSCWTHGNMIEEVLADAETWNHEAPGLMFGALRRRVAINRAPKFTKVES